MTPYSQFSVNLSVIHKAKQTERSNQTKAKQGILRVGIKGKESEPWAKFPYISTGVLPKGHSKQVARKAPLSNLNS